MRSNLRPTGAQQRREGYCLFLALYHSNDALMSPALPFFLHLTYLRRKS